MPSPNPWPEYEWREVDLALELDRPVAERGGIHVLYPPDRGPPAKVRVMIDHLAEAFAGAPP
jgi:DNA-binding transcriptional LysR family regulator